MIKYKYQIRVIKVIVLAALVILLSNLSELNHCYYRYPGSDNEDVWESESEAKSDNIEELKMYDCTAGVKNVITVCDSMSKDISKGINFTFANIYNYPIRFDNESVLNWKNPDSGEWEYVDIVSKESRDTSRIDGLDFELSARL